VKKKVLIGLLILGVPALALAAWLFVINADVVGEAISLPGYATLALNIPALNVNTTQGADSTTEYVNFTVNRNANFSVIITETYQDNSGGECEGGQGDCTMIYSINNESGVIYEIHNGDNVILEASRDPRRLTATMSCIAYSCPQTRTADITLTEASR